LNRFDRMLQESEIIPYHLSPPAGERALVLAPHPDDETLGCGGAIRLLVESGKSVKVVFVTSGDRGDPEHPLSRIPGNSAIYNRSSWLSGEGITTGLSDENHLTGYASLREKEAVRALGVLGVSDYEFLRFPDRELHLHYKNVLDRVIAIAEEFMPDAMYSPSVIELNPDHRTTAGIALEVQRRKMAAGAYAAGRLMLVFYEVTTPLRPNMLVDITPVQNRKKKAMKKYKSQMRLIDFLTYIISLNTVRALTVKARYAEAFWRMEAPLSDKERERWLAFQQTL